MADAPIVVENLTRRFRTKVALDNASLTVPKGCVFGLLGESGAGKTTLMKHLLGLLSAQQGTVRVMGVDPVKRPEVALQKIGYLSEDRDISHWMKLVQLLRYTQGFYPNWDTEFAAQLIDTFDLNVTQKVATFSKGQKAKTGLCLALAHRPDLLILDEPSSGLDVVVRRHILDQVMRNVADDGRSVLFSSHLMDEVERVADYIAIVHRGSICLTGPLDEIKQAHTNIALEFDTIQEQSPQLNGTLHCEGSGKHWTALAHKDDPTVEQAVANSGARVLEETTPSLEDIFVACVGGITGVTAGV